MYYAGLILLRKITVIPQRKSNPMSPPAENNAVKEKVFWHPEPSPYAPTANAADQELDQEGPENWQQDEDQQDHSFEALQMLANDIDRIIGDHVSYPDKASMMAEISKHVALYPVLSDAAFKSAIGNIIIKAAKVDRDLEITRSETDTLWEQPE
ncbi:hypothetical protein DCC81_03695 [Chitinophaga parva]|uniref:Uncharacterized protein n=1 Tax=Chitinophaga parva TaxID=2169414 RepID=A0A2T7BLN9_9BACT|nr:hypothetical protein DCC81_03695 [Chitinophaga parva]